MFAASWKNVSSHDSRFEAAWWDEHPFCNHIYRPHRDLLNDVTLRDSVGRKLGLHAQIEKCNQVCPFAHADEVVPSGC